MYVNLSRDLQKVQNNKTVATPANQLQRHHDASCQSEVEQQNHPTTGYFVRIAIVKLHKKPR